MTYSAALEYLYAQLPMFHRIGPAAFKKDLTNSLALAEYLGHPERKFRSIHVGGTNGKGSVSHMLAAICQAAGLKTGLYISPHYRDFRERIKINGQYIPKKAVVDFVERHRGAVESIQPSFFEWCVAMAFDYFARERVDIAIIEVGLGGRLDSTNIITPLLSVITNISYDHQAMLGDTLTLIAGEKAGIIKPGIPAVIGETHPESAPVFVEKARSVGAPLVFADQHFEAELLTEHWTDKGMAGSYRILKNRELFADLLTVETGGPYQQRNLATVLQVWEQLRLLEPRVDERALRGGLEHLKSLTRFMGRWEVIGRQPTILCDSAHNEAGLDLAFQKIRTIPYRRLHVVTGFVNDKSVEKVLKYYPADARYYFAKANIPRGLDAGLLRETAHAFGLHGRAYVSVRQALKAARRAAAPDDLIVVIGSIFVVAEVL